MLHYKVLFDLTNGHGVCPGIQYNFRSEYRLSKITLEEEITKEVKSIDDKLFVQNVVILRVLNGSTIENGSCWICSEDTGEVVNVPYTCERELSEGDNLVVKDVDLKVILCYDCYRKLVHEALFEKGLLYEIGQGILKRLFPDVDWVK